MVRRFKMCVNATRGIVGKEECRRLVHAKNDVTVLHVHFVSVRELDHAEGSEEMEEGAGRKVPGDLSLCTASESILVVSHFFHRHLHLYSYLYLHLRLRSHLMHQP